MTETGRRQLHLVTELTVTLIMPKIIMIIFKMERRMTTMASTANIMLAVVVTMDRPKGVSGLLL